MLPTAAEILRLSQLSETLVSRAFPVAFCHAVSYSDQAEVFRQRFDTVVARGWGSRSDYPDGQERDEHDVDAVQIQGRYKGQLVASGRLVFPSPGRSLPVEANHDLRLDPRGKFVELGRTIVSATNGGQPRKHLFAALIGFALSEMVTSHYFVAVASADAAMLRLYRRLGIQANVLGPPSHVCGDARYPVAIEVVSFIRQSNRIFQTPRADATQGEVAPIRTTTTRE